MNEGDSQFIEQGYEEIERFLSDRSITKILEEIGREDAGSVTGVRNAEKKYPYVNDLIHSDLLKAKARTYLSGEPQFVRAILFDKSAEKNWYVTWHQDKTIALRNKKSVPGWEPWTLKEGIHHVQPERNVLDNMVTFRIHLDSVDQDNGCLRVIPGSHRTGILGKKDLDLLVKEAEAVHCTAKPGDLLVMRPLILHSSSKARVPSRRRILHIEYSSFSLPKGLMWA